MVTSRIATLPGDSTWPNEDLAVAQGQLLVLLDGATAPQGIDTGCRHSVTWYVHELAPAIVRHAQHQETPLTEALADAITDVRKRHATTCDLSNPESPSSTVVLARITDQGVESLVLADSSLIVHRNDNEPVVVSDQRLQQLKTTSSPSSNLAAVRNQPGGFWVAQTDPQAANNALLNRWPLVDLTGLTALSDGAARPVEVFATRTWTRFAAELEAADPAAILAAIRTTEASDPNRTLWPRSKTHDDATIARIILGPTAESGST